MSDDRLKTLKEQFISVVESQMTDLKNVDAKEMGEVIDIIKDLAETCYYCKITDAMDKNTDLKNKEYMDEYLPETSKYYGRIRPIRYYDPNWDMNRNDYDRMYYSEPSYRNRMYYDSTDDNKHTDYSDVHHDPNDGLSYKSRRGYMELKSSPDRETRTKELEHYLKDLSEDVVDMMANMDTAEKQIVKQKITAIASKI